MFSVLRRSFLSLLSYSILAVLTGPVAHAGGAAETHDGFYLRLNMGGGYTSMSTEVSGAKLKVSGSGGGIGVALGGVVAGNLVVFGELFDNIVSNPTVTLDGVSVNTKDTSAGVVGVGPGAAYYLPMNMFVSGTLAFSRLVLDTGSATYRSNTGIGFSVKVGKEWWVSNNWGLGLCGQFYAGTMKESSGGNPTWTTSAFAILFSATYN